VLSENDYRKQSIHLFIFNFLPLVVLKSCGKGWLGTGMPYNTVSGKFTKRQDKTGKG
jgi:hypothetical protein